MTDKTPNYSDEMVVRLHEVYDGEADEATRDAQVAQLAGEAGRSAGSVRAKLSSEGVYVAKAKAPSGKNTVRKSALVSGIAGKLGVTEVAVESLEKATKSALTLLYASL